MKKIILICLFLGASNIFCKIQPIKVKLAQSLLDSGKLIKCFAINLDDIARAKSQYTSPYIPEDTLKHMKKENKIFVGIISDQIMNLYEPSKTILSFLFNDNNDLKEILEKHLSQANHWYRFLRIYFFGPDNDDIEIDWQSDNVCDRCCMKCCFKILRKKDIKKLFSEWPNNI